MRILSKLLAVSTLLSFSCAAVAAPNPNAKRDAKWRADVKSVFHVPAVLPPVHAKTWSSFSPAKSVKADRVTYDTADGMVVTAIVYMPDPLPKGAMPGLVVVNGHGATSPAGMRTGAAYSSRAPARWW